MGTVNNVHTGKKTSVTNGGGSWFDEHYALEPDEEAVNDLLKKPSARLVFKHATNGERTDGTQLVRRLEAVGNHGYDASTALEALKRYDAQPSLHI